MGADSKSAAKSKGGTAQRADSPAPVYWSARGTMRGRPRLKLLGALRGEGQLIWTGGEVTAAYELDIFGSGEARSASGNLEGDLSALPLQNPDDPELAPITGARLRLSGGREIAIDLTSLEPGFAEFEARLTATDADLLP